MRQKNSEILGQNSDASWRRQNDATGQTEYQCPLCSRWLSANAAKMTFSWNDGVEQQPVCHDCRPPKQSGPTMMNPVKRPTGNVKVISFPEGFTSRINKSPIVMREEWHVIVLEDEEGNISRLPEVCCKQVLHVGKWYKMFQTNAVLYPKYQFTYLTEKNDGYSITKQTKNIEQTSPTAAPLPYKNKRIVTVLEQPTETNYDCFVVKLSDGMKENVSYWDAQSFFAVGEKAILEIQIRKDGNRKLSLKPGKLSLRKPLPLPVDAVRRTHKGVEVSNGIRWAPLEYALIEGWTKLEKCGQHLGTKRICDGAIGSAMEYTINMSLWKVENVYILDLRDEGEGYEFYKSRKAVDARMREIREQGGAY